MRDDSPDIRELLRRFRSVAGFHDRTLAYVVGVSPAQVSKWQKTVARKLPIQVNDATREAISEVLARDGRPDLRLAGMQQALERMKVTVEDIDEAIRLRRALREVALTTPTLSELDALAEKSKSDSGTRPPPPGKGDEGQEGTG